MLARLHLKIVAAAILLVIVSPCSRAQIAQKPGTSVPDLSGLWSRPAEIGPRASHYFTLEEPSMLPWAEDRYKAVRRDKKGLTDPRPDQGRDDMDPGQYPYCMPFGFPRLYAYTDSFEIRQLPDRVYVLFDSGPVQRIYTDGRKHPQGPPLTFMGQSIGKWDGDTLIVETKDMNDLTWIDSMGHPHSDALRVEQRIRRVDHNTIEMNFLFDDPKTYKKPWGGKKVYKLQKNDIVMNYYLCDDPMRDEFERKVLNNQATGK